LLWQIRLQLETLLAEKARLAHENSVYARENRFLREIVEYHQLTMQDVVYLDEGSEEVTEVYPFTKMLSVSPPSPTSPSDTTLSSLLEKEIYPVPDLPQETQEVSESDVPPNAGKPALKEEEEEETGSDAPQSAGVPALKEVEDARSGAPPSAGVPALKEVEDTRSDASPGVGIPVLEEKEEEKRIPSNKEEEEEEEEEKCTSKSAVHEEEKAKTPSASYGVNK